MNSINRQRLLNALGLAALLVIAVALVACGGSNEPAQPTSPPPATNTSTPQAPVGDDAWSRIQATGHMSVGTSADYPPFAFYTQDFQLDGYDIALIRAVAGKLGVEADIRDMAFDGLGSALQVNQMDAAIAAISVTDERRQFVDFSNVYFVSEDAVLARAGESYAINTVRDLAQYRVGVQAGSVYQDWLQTELIDTGLMPAQNLFVYSETTQAVEDLGDSRIDLVVADLQPLELAAQSGVFEIVQRGLNRQLFAIAVPKGSTLLPYINQALVELQNDGTLADLAATYMNLDIDEVAPVPTPQPTPLPEATATAIPPSPTPAGCVDAMAFVGDLNLDDQNMTAPPVMNPGQSFQKGWRIRNIGTCTWDSRYLMTYVNGNVPEARMGGLPTPIQGFVPPGATYDMYVSLVAPLVPGTYQGFWSLRNPNGLLFGDRVWVGITVPSPATPTPPPTATPSASVSFTVDRTTITAGQCVTFSWDVRNASSVYFYSVGENWAQNQVQPQGSQRECPPVTTTYELRVIKPDNSQETRNIRIDVTQPQPDAPVIQSFTLNPANQIQEGQCVDVRWQVTGDVNSVSVARNGNALWDGAPLNGTTRDCPPVGTAAYTVVASGAGGTANAQQNLSVIPQPTTPPQVTPTPVPPTPTPQPAPPPVINAFSVSPAQIQAGQCVSINWSVGGTVNLVQLKRNGNIVVDNATLNGNVTDCLDNAGTYTYRIEASNNAGQNAFQQASVTVGNPEPPAGNPLVGTSWQLVTLNGAPVLTGSEITVIFGDGSNLSGSAGCNNYTGTYGVNGISMSVRNIKNSQQTCPSPDGVMPQERSYLNVLGSASAFSIDGGQLTIRGTQGSLVYKPLASPR
ncbi:MAG: transporter substrate-binding domain-containing protein [Chloroflexota bacterium]